jgi:hypothetical protein
MNWYFMRLITRQGQMISHLTCANTPLEARERLEGEGYTVYSIRDCEIGNFCYLAPIEVAPPQPLFAAECSGEEPMYECVFPEGL